MPVKSVESVFLPFSEQMSVSEFVNAYGNARKDFSAVVLEDNFSGLDVSRLDLRNVKLSVDIFRKLLESGFNNFSGSDLSFVNIAQIRHFQATEFSVASNIQFRGAKMSNDSVWKLLFDERYDLLGQIDVSNNGAEAFRGVQLTADQLKILCDAHGDSILYKASLYDSSLNNFDLRGIDFSRLSIHKSAKLVGAKINTKQFMHIYTFMHFLDLSVMNLDSVDLTGELVSTELVEWCLDNQKVFLLRGANFSHVELHKITRLIEVDFDRVMKLSRAQIEYLISRGMSHKLNRLNLSGVDLGNMQITPELFSDVIVDENTGLADVSLEFRRELNAHQALMYSTLLYLQSLVKSGQRGMSQTVVDDSSCESKSKHNYAPLQGIDCVNKLIVSVLSAKNAAEIIGKVRGCIRNIPLERPSVLYKSTNGNMPAVSPLEVIRDGLLEYVRNHSSSANSPEIRVGCASTPLSQTPFMFTAMMRFSVQWGSAPSSPELSIPRYESMRDMLADACESVQPSVSADPFGSSFR